MANLREQGFRFVRREDGAFTWTHPLEKRPTDFDCTDMSDDEFAAFMCAHEGGTVGEYEDGFNEAEADVCDGCCRNDYERDSAGWHGYEFGLRLFSIVREDWEAQAAYDARWSSLPDLPEA